MSKREQMVSKIEEANAALRESGLSDAWFGDADATTLAVSGVCNGHLMEQLLRASAYEDMDCVNLLREGGCCRSRSPPFVLVFARIRCDGLWRLAAQWHRQGRVEVWWLRSGRPAHGLRREKRFAVSTPSRGREIRGSA